MGRATQFGSDIQARGELVFWHPPLGDPIRLHSSRKVNQRLDRETATSLKELARGSVLGILRRMDELDREWDLNRALIAIFALGGGASGALAVREIVRHARPGPFTAAFAVQLGVLVYYVMRGFGPPASLLRRFGFRTSQEIEQERSALEKLLDQRITAATD